MKYTAFCAEKMEKCKACLKSVVSIPVA